MGRIANLSALVAALILAATGAGAGAWPFPKGTGQLSFSVEGDRGDGTGTYSTLYAEYGLRDDRTLGLDLGFARSDADKAVVFYRWNQQPNGNSRLAYEFGIGMVDGKAALRPALSLGRPITLGNGYGWVALDARAILRDDMQGRLEADLTIGGDAGGDDKWLVQIQTAAPSYEAPYAKIAPSYAFGLGKGRHVLVGDPRYSRLQ